MILVTGAAGKTGRAVISALVGRGQYVRALVHRNEQVQLVEPLGVREVNVGDMRSQSVLTQAVRGVRAIYHICPNVHPDEVAIGRAAIAAARAAKVEQFVFHSVLHPQVEAMPHHWSKMRVEEALFESELPFTVLQPASYMQNVLSEWQAIVERGVYSVPYSLDSPFSMVDLPDVAEAAATVLCEPSHLGATYELAGPDVLTPRKVAQTIGKHLGHQVRAEEVTVGEWKSRARAAGLGVYQLETLAKMFQYYDHYGLWGNPRVLTSLIRRAPTKFDEFAERTIMERGESSE